jgi:ammonium transporter Rh
VVESKLEAEESKHSKTHDVKSNSGEYDQLSNDLLGACQRGDAVATQRLLSDGAKAWYADYDQRTPLHLAACENSVDCARLVFEAMEKAETDGKLLRSWLNAQDRWNHTPLDDAVRLGKKEMVTFLQEKKADHSDPRIFAQRLIEATANRNQKEVESLLDNKVDPNSMDYDRRTALHLAVATGDEKLANLLLERGANAKIRDRFGQTAYDLALHSHSRTGTDPVQEIFKSKFPEHVEETGNNGWHDFLLIFGLAQLIMLILFAAYAKYSFHAEAALDEDPFSFNYLSDTYSWFMDVHVMIFIGFGFLMTFLRKYSFSAVGLTFLIGGFVLQWHILVEAFVEYFIVGHHDVLHINVKALVLGDFAAGAVLVSYGVLLGKVSFLQMLLIATFECIFYTFNETIGLEMGITDIGGSMVIHMFGAFFGLSCSMAMKSQWKDAHTHNNVSVYHSDTFAMFGSVFLWMFWPSFNAVLGGSDELRHLAVVNTVLSLCGSCVAAFIASYYFRRGEFCMVDIQNATLAGGVAMGSSADLFGNPGVSILIGAFAGVISVIGYTIVQPYLETSFGIHDTCGVHNLHGMPSIIGALASIIILAIYEDDNGHVSSTIPKQAGFLVITLLMSITTGTLTGLIALGWCPPPPAKRMFDDSYEWEVPSLEFPFNFDHHNTVDPDAKIQKLMDAERSEKSQLKRLQTNVSDLEGLEHQLDAVLRKLDLLEQIDQHT